MRGVAIRHTAGPQKMRNHSAWLRRHPQPAHGNRYKLHSIERSAFMAASAGAVKNQTR